MSLSPKQVRALDCLAKTGSVSKAATAASVSRKSIYAWLATPSFKIQLAELQASILSSSAAHLTRLGLLANDSLEQALQSNDEKVRLRACEVYYKNTLQFFDFVDTQRRLAALEDLLQRSEAN